MSNQNPPSTHSVPQTAPAVKIEPARCVDGYYLTNDPLPTPHGHAGEYDPECFLCCKPAKMSLVKWYLALAEAGAWDRLAAEFRSLRDQRHWKGCRNQAFYDLSWLIPVMRRAGMLGCVWEEQ